MKTFKKVAIVSALTLTMIATTAVQSMAFSIGRTPYEKAARDFANSMEAFGEQTGNKYEKAAESFADSMEIFGEQTGNSYENAAESFADSMEIFGEQTGNSYENAAEEYADSVETVVDQTGNSYEDSAESYPDNASGSLETSNEIGNNFFEKIFSMTSNFLKNIFRI